MTDHTQANTADVPPYQGIGAFLRGFREGLLSPSLTSVLLAVAIPAGIFATAAVYLTPELMTTAFHRRVAMNRFDDGMFIAARAFQLSNAQLDKPAVFILGSSATRNSIPSETFVADEVRKHSGVEVKAFNLASGGQYVWETEALAHMLPPKFDGVVLIGVVPRGFYWDEDKLQELLESPRLALEVDVLDRPAQEAGITPPRRCGNYFWDQRRFFLPRLEGFLRGLNKKPVEHNTARLNRGRNAPHNWKQRVEESHRSREAYRKNKQVGMEALRRAVEDVRQRGRIAVVLVEEPMSPQFREDAYGGGFYESYQEDMRAFARQLGVPYWDVNETGVLSEDDFYDWAHVDTKDAQQRWTAALAQRVASLLAETLPEQSNEED